MIFLKRKIARWKKATIIDEVIASKILVFEEERLKRFLLKVAAILGLPVIFFAIALILMGFTLQIQKELALDLTLIGITLIFTGSFMWFLSKNKIKKEYLITVLISFFVGAILLTFILFANSSPIYLAMADWVALSVVVFLLSKGKRKTAMGFGFAYLICSLLYQQYAFGEIQGGLDGWIILFISSWRTIYALASIGFIWVFIKIIIPILIYIRRKIAAVAAYVGLRRTVVVIFLTAFMILGNLRSEAEFLKFLLGRLDTETIGATGLYITLLTLIPKERPSFSMVFCLVGWLEIVGQAVLISKRNAIYVFDDITYEPGPMLISLIAITFFVIISTFAAKKNETTNDVMGLGPVGVITFMILIASIRL